MDTLNAIYQASQIITKVAIAIAATGVAVLVWKEVFKRKF